jgi:hypothetical protein
MSNSNSTLTDDRLRELFEYNHTDGLFVRLSTGRPVQTRNQGYVVIAIDGKAYKAHRLAWLYVYGVLPDGVIDHINRDRSDNRMCNLRLTTRAPNPQNSTIARSASGVRGVSRVGACWKAAIAVDGKEYYLGTFATIPEAAAARAQAEAKLHPLSPLSGQRLPHSPLR